MEIGQRIGDYEIAGILGAGGMGKVYKVRNVISDRNEAMKVLLPSLKADPELGDRFLREIRVQASLDHPNIAALHTAQSIGDQLVMIMEFVEGVSLDKLIQRGPVPLDKALSYTAQVLSALAYAHARGVVHRDIKPQNIMLAEGEVVKLMDFGIARLAADRRLTQTGRTVGSLYYMSPEQIKGALDLDGRADLYSLGVTLYEMVTGRKPFEGDSDFSIMAAHLEKAPVPPVQVDPALPPGLNDAILMSIAKDPSQRFQTAEAFGNALAAVRGTVAALGATPTIGSTQQQPPAAAPVAATRNRRGLYMAVGSVLTLAVLVGAATQLPKLFHTSAGGPAENAIVEPAQTPPQPEPVAETPDISPQTAAPQTAAAPAPAVEPPPVKAPEIAPKRAERQAARVTVSAPEINSPVPASANTAAAIPTPTQSIPSTAVAGGEPAGGRSAQTAPDQAALQKLEQRMMLMAARVAGVSATLTRMEREMAAQGLGMRSDFVSAQRRLELHMDQGEAALKRGDAAAGGRSLDAAERELETLEKALGK
ncbi:MAG: protein kinase [Bryobacteraceae bacterium]|nr:protein kinase [Bryobacterales bacterium]NUN01481.1 protein kinase [Bryobacteraceae bacterium]